ncbi:APC family permease [uncultured Jatrophihabitans sp.]|uniref:APC family permease n=1 Tax=uncultured Jatrophihabitans sp. TaxID=1610747 RepID=UPI0035C9925D
MAIEDLARTGVDTAAPAESTGRPPALKAGSIGLIAVLFMAVANAAPITAMTGNVPIAVAYGNGTFAPAGFLVATVVLTLFTVGFVQMAKHITTAGAFFGFITHGLGTVWGMASGAIATMAYVVFEGSLVGIFSYFADDAMNQWFGVHWNWLIYAAICIAACAVFGYYDISIAAVVLGVFLVCEVVLLAALALSVLVKGGGPQGLHPSSINPVKAFTGLSGNTGVKVGGAPLAAGSAAIGLFFAFWSWVGFETTAVYGEESRNPRRIVPRATLIAVVGLGLFYTFVSWMVISGDGLKGSVDKAANNGIGMFTDLAAQNLGGHWVVNVYLFLIVSGSFACALAFHNAASRYLFSIGRELPSLRRLGATHHKHGSPHIASAVQTAVTIVLTLAFYFGTVGGDKVLQGAYTYEYGLLAVMGTMAILVVQAICSFSVIWYFQVKKVHPGNIVTTGIIPAIGGLGMIYVVYLLLDNLDFAGGGGAKSPFFHAMPYIVIAVFVLAGAGVLVLRKTNPQLYRSLGRTVLADSHER